MKGAAFTFASEVDRQIEAIPADDYRMHTRPAKRLLEELLPISRLGLYLKQPGLDVEIEAFENDGPIDGRIQITGFRQQTLNVQVTCDFTYEERLRMKAVSLVGSVAGSGPISRNRRTGQIEAVTVAVDIEEHYKRVAEAIRNLSLKKIGHRPPKDTALLVAFDEVKVRGLRSWCRLLAAVDQVGGVERGGFTAIYLFNGASNEIQQA